jgi:hypothetical protein
MMFSYKVCRNAGFVLALALGLVGISATAYAQLEVYAKVIANPEGATSALTFDINSVTTDNVSPNIILSQDEKRAFVAYTQSGMIVEFSLIDGAILNRIDTGYYPCFGTKLTNNRIAYVSVFEDKRNWVQGKRIFIVDMGSEAGASSLVKTYSFDKAAFGFGSILELSPDKTIGYISSTGSAEIIKFNIADGTEIARITGPSDTAKKLRFPARITITPDGATLMVVDTDPATPEVAFYDTTTYEKKGSLTNPDPTKIAVAFTIFNKAVLAPDGLTGIIASRGMNNVMYSETVFHFNAADGTILDYGDTGSGPQWTGITPDGKKWVIINMYSITVIPTDDFDSLVQFDAPQGESLGSANMVFTADSKYGYYAASGDTGLIPDLILQVNLDTGNFVDYLQVGDSANSVVDQASSMAITSDGKTVIALEMVGENIDLMRPVTLVAGAKFYTSPSTFTGISLLNLSSVTNKVTLYAISNYGEPFTDGGATNPVTLYLAPNEQISQTVSQLFNFNDLNPEVTEHAGWLAIYCEQPEITGYVALGPKDLSSLNGIPLDFVSDRLRNWILPVVNRNGDASVYISSLNASRYAVSYDISRVGHDGEIIDSANDQSVSARMRAETLMTDVFASDDLDLEGYLWMASVSGVFSTEIYSNGTSTEIIKGIDFKKFADATKFYAPQWATVSGWKTKLNLINANEEEADITVTFHSGDNSVLWQFQTRLNPGEQIVDDVTALFAAPPNDFNVTVADPTFLSAAGWLEVESTLGQIVGLITFTATDDHFAASYELTGTPLAEFLFPIVSHNDVDLTGVALLNPNSEAAEVTLELWGMDGNIIATTSITIDPQSRIAAYMDQLFVGMDPLLMGNLRIRSDKTLCGFALINDAKFTFLMAMPAVAKF